jgi:GH25 family lysozyme M1 (1,4-beta-N-acetylmuramidase)
MGLKTAKTSATSRLSARNLKATEYYMNSSPNSKISAALALKARRVALLSATALLSMMLCLGGSLPAQADPASPTAPPSPEAPASTAPASPSAAATATTSQPAEQNAPESGLVQASQTATQPEPGPIDMAALRAEIGKDGAYLGQGVKRRATTFAKQSTASSLNAISTEAANTWMAPGVQGLDVSSHQTTVNWAAQYIMGARFAYVKATEGTTYTNDYFGTQYGGALASGMIRGAYHFALPGVSTASAQADFFVNSGGGWTGDGKTMPPLLDIEYNPYASLGNTCYNMSQTGMVNWIAAFSNRVLARTGRLPMIYTTTDWWSQCTGNSGAFRNQPLHLASYSRYVGSMPNGWGTYSVWQYSSTGPFAGDSNAWNGDLGSLQKFASTADGTVPTPSITSLGDVVAADSSGVLWDYPATGSGTFRARKQIGAGWTGLRSINAIDWNADGVLDLVAQWRTGRVNVYLGIASGGFATGPVLAASGWGNYQLTIGYWFNSSYYPQIISRDDAGVLQLWNNTSGAGVSGGTAIAQGWGGLNLTMIDFDGDGNQDILAQNPAGAMLLYRTNGSGGFIAEPRKTIGSGWNNMTSVTVTTNFKGTGTNGLMVRNAAGQLYYYPVPGTSTWGPVISIGTGWASYLIAGGETINAAPAPAPPAPVTPSIKAASDLITIDPSGNLYRRSSDAGTVGTASKIGSGFTGLVSVYVVDWTGDGIQDLATLSTTGDLGIQAGLGTGGFASRTVLASGLSGSDLTFGQWLKASKYPGVVIRTADGTLQFRANPSGGALAPATSFGSGFARMDVSMTDADGDGNQDILALDYLGRMVLYRSGGTGTLIVEARKLLATGWNTKNSISPIKGFASAGSNGLLARDRTGELGYYPLTAGTMGTKSVLPSGWNGLLIAGSSLLVPELAITSIADVLTVDSAGGLWNRPAANSKIGSAYQIGVGWSGMKSLNVVDWNGDGVTDVLAQRSSGPLTLFPGSTSGGFGAAVTVASSGFGQTNLVTGKWVSGSRYPGLVGYGADGALYYWANATGRTVSAPVRIGAGWSGLKLAMIDYDSDGKQDLLAVNTSGAMRLYRSTGANRFISEARKTVGTGWQSFRQFSANKGFAGTTSKGVMAVQSDGQLRYYPVAAGSRWGTSFIAGSVGMASTVASTSGAS